MVDNLQDLYTYVDGHQEEYKENLSKWIEYESVSSRPEVRDQVIAMVKQCATELEALGATVELCENPANVNGTDPENPQHPFSPIILGYLGNDSSKKTLLVYGHLDVQPATQELWDNLDPFKLTEREDKWYGRGTTDDKGPVLCWLKCIEAYQKLNKEIPVNLKFCFEGMEESGSTGLDELIENRKDTFFKGVDFTCISDNYWLTTEKPCLTYGLRGVAYFFADMEGGNQNLHSGVYGGTVYEPFTDLVHLFSKLVDQTGKILIPGVNELVAPLTNEEEALYDSITFDPEVYKSEIGVTKLLHEGDNTKIDTLQHRWRYPTLSIHGFFDEGDTVEKGATTVIPRKVTGKFSLRLVPNQDPNSIKQLVEHYCKKIHAESGSPNILTVRPDASGDSWLSDFTSDNYAAGKKAIERVYLKTPDFTREGGSIPVTLSMEEATGTSVMMLPIGSSDDGAHSQNEKINISNFLNGIKVYATYLDEVSKLTSSPSSRIKTKKSPRDIKKSKHSRHCQH